MHYKISKLLNDPTVSKFEICDKKIDPSKWFIKRSVFC